MERYRHKDLASLEQYEKTPLSERLKAFNTLDMIKNGAAIGPDSPAISFITSGDNFQNPITFSYKELVSKIIQTANFFNDLGLKPGRVVSYLLPNLPQTHFTLWGGEAAGIVNPINPLLEAATIKDICLAAETRVLVALGPTPGVDIWEKVMAGKDDLPQLEAVVRVGGSGETEEGVYDFDESIARYSPEKLDSGRVIAPDDIASIFHTGGTTGTPKLAPHTHYNEAAMALQCSAITDFEPGETVLSGLPLFHVNAATITGSQPFSMGGRVVILGPSGYRDPSIIANFFRIIEHYKAVMFSAVPTVLAMLLDVPKGEADLSSLRFAVCGAAPLSVELFVRFEEYTGLRILEGYGLTEGTCVSSVNPLFGERKVGSIGLRLPYHQVQVFIVDDDGRAGREAETDEIGVIGIKGDNVFSGYMDPLHNRGIWLYGEEEGWFNTGDMGRRDADGYTWLTGRKKELIIRGGHNIDPAMIEGPLYRLDGVAVAAAVGGPDPHAGEVPIAYVELQEGADLTPEQIMDYLRAEVGERAAVPKKVRIIDQMPLTPVGKIFKPKLRWDAIERAFTAELAALGDMAESVEVRAQEDKVHGTLARVVVKPAAGMDAAEGEARVRDLLARYPVRYEVEVV